MSLNYTRIAAAGLIGTLAMTAVGLYGAPMMGLEPMNPASMLAGAMGGVAILGWMAHLMIGVVLAFGYALVSSRLPGPAPLRGAVYSLAPWLVAQVAVMPMMGMPIFSGSLTIAMGSLIGHLVYGAVVGAVAGVTTASPPLRATKAVA